MPAHDARVDAYLAKAAPFAQPILTHLREAIHQAVPDVEETMKWSRPFFVYRGVILGNVSAFKEHCSFGLWGGAMAATLKADGIDSKDAMGSFGRLTSIKDLPPKKDLVAYIRRAAALIADGARTKSIQRVAKPTPRAEAQVPAALAAALSKNKQAGKKFEAMAPSCRREYCEWIADAKKDETRDRRVAQAVEWIAEGKSRNWKYEQPRA